MQQVPLLMEASDNRPTTNYFLVLVTNLVVTAASLEEHEEGTQEVLWGLAVKNKKNKK